MKVRQYEKMSDLEPIIKYKMNELEAKAFKIAIIWQEECEKELPNESFAKLKKNSDPRKSTLFKYCYKLAREMKGILEDKDLKMYVRAQLQILKSIREGDVHALIEPHCLVGDKAWKRWKIWHRMYHKKLNRALTSDQIGIYTKESKVIIELKKTLEFMKSREFNKYENLEQSKENIERWCANNEISCFYLILSPWIRRIFGPTNPVNFDEAYYRSSITPRVEDFFRKEFSYEFEELK